MSNISLTASVALVLNKKKKKTIKSQLNMYSRILNWHHRTPVSPEVLPWQLTETLSPNTKSGTGHEMKQFIGIQFHLRKWNCSRVAAIALEWL